PAVAFLDRPAGEGAERRRGQCLAASEVKAGVVPGAPDRIADEKTVGERSMIMRAMGRDRRDLATVPDQQDFVVAEMSGKHVAFRQFACCDSLAEVRPLRLVVVGHFAAPVLSPCRPRCKCRRLPIIPALPATNLSHGCWGGPPLAKRSGIG